MIRSAFLFCLLSITLASAAQKISYDPPPNLPQHLSQDDYKRLVDTSIAVISKKYKVETVEAGSVHIEDDHQKTAVLNLDNLILKCKEEPDRSVWPAIIRDHFDKLFSTIDQQRQLDPTSYEKMKKYLSIRIYQKETVDQRGGTDSLVSRTDLPGTYTLLMLDFPGAFTPVRAAMFARWKVDTADVFRVAQANVDSVNVQKATKPFELGGTQVEITMLGEENYAASYALDLAHNAPELLGEWGCALAMPNKGLVSICKISRDKPLDFVKFIQLTQPFIEKSYQEQPQPISDQYFWYYQGKFIRIETTLDASGHLSVLPPTALTDLMTQKP
jgi:hypothetical protein